jgi:hypothetical protein
VNAAASSAQAKQDKTRLRLPDTQPTPPITVGVRREPDSAGGRWGRVLVWFMRVTAAMWLLYGLSYWRVILDPGAGGDGVAFAAMPLARQSGIVLFATLDLIAAVGLWLISPWGGVVWLFTALAQIVAVGVLPQLGLGSPATLVWHGAMVGLFFLLNILAARESVEG